MRALSLACALILLLVAGTTLARASCAVDVAEFGELPRLYRDGVPTDFFLIRQDGGKFYVSKSQTPVFDPANPPAVFTIVPSRGKYETKAQLQEGSAIRFADGRRVLVSVPEPGGGYGRVEREELISIVLEKDERVVARVLGFSADGKAIIQPLANSAAGRTEKVYEIPVAELVGPSARFLPRPVSDGTWGDMQPAIAKGAAFFKAPESYLPGVLPAVLTPYRPKPVAVPAPGSLRVGADGKVRLGTGPDALVLDPPTSESPVALRYRIAPGYESEAELRNVDGQLVVVVRRPVGGDYQVTSGDEISRMVAAGQLKPATGPQAHPDLPAAGADEVIPSNQFGRRQPPLSPVDTMIGGKPLRGTGHEFIRQGEIIGIPSKVARVVAMDPRDGAAVIRYAEDGRAVIQQQAQRGCTAGAAEMLIVDNGGQPSLYNLRNTNLGDEKTIMERLRQAHLEPIEEPIGGDTPRARMVKLAELIRVHGSATVSVGGELGGHQIVVDRIVVDAVPPYAIIRDPWHGWQISVHLSALERRFSGSAIFVKNGRGNGDRPFASSGHTQPLRPSISAATYTGALPPPAYVLPLVARGGSVTPALRPGATGVKPFAPGADNDQLITVYGPDLNGGATDVPRLGRVLSVEDLPESPDHPHGVRWVVIELDDGRLLSMSWEELAGRRPRIPSDQSKLESAPKAFRRPPSDAELASARRPRPWSVPGKDDVDRRLNRNVEIQEQIVTALRLAVSKRTARLDQARVLDLRVDADGVIRSVDGVAATGEAGEWPAAGSRGIKFREEIGAGGGVRYVIDDATGLSPRQRLVVNGWLRQLNRQSALTGRGLSQMVVDTSREDADSAPLILSEYEEGRPAIGLRRNPPVENRPVAAPLARGENGAVRSWVPADEALWVREPNAEVTNSNYVGNGRLSAEHFAKELMKGTPMTGERFQEISARMHVIATTGGDAANPRPYKNKSPGEFRSESRMVARREALEYARAISRRYGLGTVSGDEGGEFRMKIEGLAEEHGPTNIGATHSYSPPKSFPEYFRVGAKHLNDILLMTNGPQRGTPEVRLAVRFKILEFYHLMANARPYENVNNSLFLSQANVLLRMNGHPGLAPAYLDHLAHRLNWTQFKKLMEQTVLRNPSVAVPLPSEPF